MPTATVRIKRQNPKAGQGHRWDAFEVPTFDKMSVLDAVFWVQGNQDPSLAFRCSCRVGICGSCGMVINGKERLACRTLVASLGSDVSLEPMNRMPVVRDLVVDMSPFFEKYRKAMPYFLSADPSPDSEPAILLQDAKEREVIDAQRECINCGLCYSTCDMVDMDNDFLGPAALNRAYVLVADPRDGAKRQRLELVASESGLWRCHTLFNCAAVCPKGIWPAVAIQRLKRKAVVHRLKRLIPFATR